MLRSLPTKTEFTPASYYVKPVVVASFIVPPSGVSSSIVQQEVSSNRIAMSTIPDRTQYSAHTSRRHRYMEVSYFQIRLLSVVFKTSFV